MNQAAQTLLLTGATGFVGRHVYDLLARAGWAVRCASRRPEQARALEPHKHWVSFDVDRSESLDSALSGCTSAVYLVHRLQSGSDYPEREVASALAFREAAARAGVQRIVYLGGVAPVGPPSPHLQSRIRTGETLRAGSVPVIELRAGMVIGHGSASWMMVRDLAKRLPLMLLPRWLDHRSAPVAMRDVATAIGLALSRAPGPSTCLQLPGPELLTHRELLRRAATLMNRHPVFFPVPVVTPTLSSYWIGLVTRVDLDLARELVQGLQSDLLPVGPSIWDERPDQPRTSIDEAMRLALAEESVGR